MRLAVLILLGGCLPATQSEFPARSPETRTAVLAVVSPTATELYILDKNFSASFNDDDELYVLHLKETLRDLALSSESKRIFRSNSETQCSLPLPSAVETLGFRNGAWVRTEVPKQLLSFEYAGQCACPELIERSSITVDAAAPPILLRSGRELLAVADQIYRIDGDTLVPVGDIPGSAISVDIADDGTIWIANDDHSLFSGTVDAGFVQSSTTIRAMRRISASNEHVYIVTRVDIPDEKFHQSVRRLEVATDEATLLDEGIYIRGERGETAALSSGGLTLISRAGEALARVENGGLRPDADDERRQLFGVSGLGETDRYGLLAATHTPLSAGVRDFVFQRVGNGKWTVIEGDLPVFDLRSFAEDGDGFFYGADEGLLGSYHRKLHYCKATPISTDGNPVKYLEVEGDTLIASWFQYIEGVGGFGTVVWLDIVR